MTIWKKTKYKSDLTQKDKILMRQNTKRQNTNATKLKKTKYKCDKTQKERLQIWQNTIKTYAQMRQYTKRQNAIMR